MLLFFVPASLKSQPVPGRKGLPQEQFRYEMCLNGLWDFKCDADNEWTRISVPGSYSILQNSKWGRLLWDAFKYPKEWNNKGAIYRRNIELPKDMTGKVATFYCGASCFHTYVSMNDKPVGEFHDGFFPFEFPLNDALKKGAKENMLTVRVSAENELTSSGESSGNRGIQEDTYLKIYPNIYVDPHAIVVETFVKDKQLEVNVQVNNTSGNNEKIFIRNFITDTLGQVVKIFDGGWVDVPARSSVQKIVTDTWQNPHLWTLYDPYLYHLHTVLYTRDGKPFDKNTLRFGFREISIEKQHLYLNGQELFLHGHGGHELGDLQGTKEYMKKWLLQMKLKGVNFMRMHIYPRHQAIYEAADEVGFFLEAEGAFHFRVSKEDSVWRMNLGNMVKYQRNHPSVLLWSVSNELRWNGGGEKNYLIDFVKGLDDTRPVFASDFSLESRLGDVVGHHYNPETVFDEWKEYGPNKPMIWDEMGSVWQEDRPLYNGTAGYEVSSQDWATGMWRDGHDQILKDIEGMIDGKKINGELHRVNGFIPWDFSYVFMRWQPTNKARNLWLQHDNLSSPGLKLRVVQPCSSPLNIWDKTLPEYEPNPGYYIFEKHIRTVRFFDTDDYQSYFGGVKVLKTGKLYYEDLRCADALHCNVESTDGKIISSNVQLLKVKSGDIQDKVMCSFSLPKVDKVTQVNLVRRFYNEGIAGYEDKLPVKIYPSVIKMLGILNSAKVAVVGNEKLTDYLRVNRVNAFPVEKGKIGDLNKFTLLITNTSSDISESVLNRYMQEGGRVLLLNEGKESKDDRLIKQSILSEDFKGVSVSDMSKGNGFISRSTGTKWIAGGGLVTASLNMLVDQIGMITFNKFESKTSFICARFDDGVSPFVVQNMANGEVNFRYDNIIDRKNYTQAQCSRDVQFLVCDRSQKWFISNKKASPQLRQKEGDVSVNLSNFTWQMAELKEGKLAISEKPGTPDLSELRGVGVVVDPKDARNYAFIISKFELKGKSFPAAKIPLNGGVHKLLSGINQSDLSFWRNSSAQKILDLPNVKNNFRTILLGNKDGDGAALYEEFGGKGIALYSGLNIISQLSTEPAAVYMLSSMLRYLTDYRPGASSPKCGIVAGEKITSIYLQKIGLVADKLIEDKLPDLSGYRVLLVDGGSLNIASRLNSKTNTVRLRNFVTRGGELIFTAMNDQTIEIYRQLTGKDIRLTVPYLNEKSHCSTLR